jgi:Na+/melibiose symporter-like transporter
MALSHSAWTATLCTNYHDRSRVFGIEAVAGVIGALVILSLPIVCAQMGADNATSVAAMGWFMVIATPVFVLIAVLKTRETITPDPPVKAKFGAAEYLAMILRPSLLRLLIADLCLSLGPNWMSALYIFFSTASRQFSVGDASLLLGLYVAAGLAGAPLTARIARRLGKHVTLMMTTTAYSLGLCCVILTPKGDVLAAAPAMFWCGFMAAGFNFMTRAMLADVSDEVRLDGGVERTSLLYALTNFTAKLASACAIGLTFSVLSTLGFDPAPGAVNSASAIRGLEIAFLAGPIFFVMIGGACFIGYRLDAARHAEIRRQLDERDALAAEAL